ncbi:unnamed protein product [Kuraishia capsulata CBS 1993]|uniref:Uncharacterized protein n=1 Tax=Kuraishia capsulata CBS 1993 TaxID=1382522 RepID=W6MJN5_9ASCO|nr:uncharacterized protein KUCA_T00002728001 [Kuraishia capsulata CBS 1993]CDK26754.1 unnamed protein product [Kuraishia capsulata CBS 1993]
MSTNSPNNSTLTISPFVRGQKKKDFYATPPNVLLPHQSSNSKMFSTPSSQNSSLKFETGLAEDPPLTQADRLRLWRHDAFFQHHYTTAEYVGDKVLSLTNDPNDAFWLAQIYYATGNYIGARTLLMGPDFEDSIACRYLAGQCLIKLEEWDEALDIIGDVNPFKTDHSTNKNLDGGIKLEASMCYLRGVIFSRQNDFERAKECFQEAVLVDAKCFEAFDELIKNNLLTPKEEWSLLNSLHYEDADINGDLVKLLYTTRLNKYVNMPSFEEAESRLREEYNLGNNADILLSRANLLFVQCKFQQCLLICEELMERNSTNFSAIPLYLSCLHELGGKNKLFLIAHELADNHPNHHVTWLAIGIYYFSIKKIGEARAFFSKASTVSPNFGPAWIGFAHTFAAESEHEQAISAYATASRLFPGSHLPNMFLGMQYLQMNNLSLADEYLSSAFSICPNDPLLLNELGVVYYHRGSLENAEQYFLRAVTAAKNLSADSKVWTSVNSNLGHVYRRMDMYGKALQCFKKVLKVSNRDVNTYTALGLVYLKMRDLTQAIEVLHTALGISSTNRVASDLLKRALEQGSGDSKDFFGKTERLGRLVQQPVGGLVTETPLNRNKGNRISSSGVNSEYAIDVMVDNLKKGAESSDEEDVMEIESD